MDTSTIVPLVITALLAIPIIFGIIAAIVWCAIRIFGVIFIIAFKVALIAIAIGAFVMIAHFIGTGSP